MNDDNKTIRSKFDESVENFLESNKLTNLIALSALIFSIISLYTSIRANNRSFAIENAINYSVYSYVDESPIRRFVCDENGGDKAVIDVKTEITGKSKRSFSVRSVHFGYEYSTTLDYTHNLADFKIDLRDINGKVMLEPVKIEQGMSKILKYSVVMPIPNSVCRRLKDDPPYRKNSLLVAANSVEKNSEIHGIKGQAYKTGVFSIVYLSGESINFARDVSSINVPGFYYSQKK